VEPQGLLLELRTVSGASSFQSLSGNTAVALRQSELVLQGP